MDSNSPKPVVIDNGTGFIKAGLADEDCPRVIQPTLIGVPKYPGIMVGMDQKDHYIGTEAVEKVEFLNMSDPIKNGYIENWDDMAKIWSQIFQELNVSSKENPLFFADTPLTPRSSREKMAEVMFETFECPSLYMYTTSVLSLFASGRTTGLVVDSGEGRTHAVPVYEGFALPHGILRLNVAGRDLTDYLLKHYIEYNQTHDFTSLTYQKLVVDIKEKHCIVAYDFDTLLKNAAENGGDREEYHLPDNSIMTIGREKFIIPEAMFQPGMIGKDSAGIADTVFKAVSNCDANIRKELYENILLSGGNCMLKKLKDRLQKDVKALAPSTINIEVAAPPERGYSAWLGGSILSHLPSFKPMFITKAEYLDQGALVVYRKCF